MADFVREGEVLVGKYRVDRILGRGGMGLVVAALHLQLEQAVALKLLLPGAAAVPEAVGRFLREARAAARIQSEHVVRVTDVGTLDSGEPFMVMELLRGMDLSQVVHATGPLAVTTAVDYLLQACEGVAEAHKLGIVHRDLKPSNLFLAQRSDGSPLVKVLDFGISKAATAAGSVALTATAAFMGSPLYMSPEQVRSARDVDARTDIWSLGVVLHELLTGAPVYRAETASAVMAMIAADPPVPVRAVRPDVPAPIEAAILRCLLKDRAQRYTSVGELAIALAPFASPRGRASAEHAARISETVVPSATMTAAPAMLGSGSPVVPTGASWGNTARQTQRRGTRAVLIGAFAGLAVVATIVILVVRRSASPAVGEVLITSANKRAEPPPIEPSAHAPTPAAPNIAEPIASGLAEPVALGVAEPVAPEVAVPDAGRTASTSKPATTSAPPAAKKAPPAPPANTARPKSPNSVFDNRTF